MKISQFIRNKIMILIPILLLLFLCIFSAIYILQNKNPNAPPSALLNKKLPMSNNKNYKDLIYFVKDRPGHDFRYAIDNKKIKSELNWSPKISFDKALKFTVGWYIKNEHWWRKILDNNYQLDRIGVK